MNELLIALGLSHWKPVLGVLLLPPVPFVLMIVAGGLLMPRRRRLAWTLLIVAALGCWFMCTGVAARWLTQTLLQPPAPLSTAQVAELARERDVAIVVLGGGGRELAPEYGTTSLSRIGIERLRYGLWLARAAALPLAFSGGAIVEGRAGATEAETAARIATTEFGQTIRWVENRSRDTHENAAFTVPLLRDQGIRHIVLVTHGFHMRRALAAFERAVQRSAPPMRLTPAAMGMAPDGPLLVIDWLPSRAGFEQVNIALHEWLGRLGGA
jgi:uncharacterized SAM-binding protein YcdF (DUF218 family)